MKTFITVLALVSTLSLTSALDINLKYGMRNDRVSELQEFLVDKGFLTTSPSGFFGLMTLKAVKAYQLSEGLPSTGFVGVLTRTKINEALIVDITSSTEAEMLEPVVVPVVTQPVNTGNFVEPVVIPVVQAPLPVEQPVIIPIKVTEKTVEVNYQYSFGNVPTDAISVGLVTVVRESGRVTNKYKVTCTSPTGEVKEAFGNGTVYCYFETNIVGFSTYTVSVPEIGISKEVVVSIKDR